MRKFVVPLNELSDKTYIEISYWQKFELLVHGIYLLTDLKLMLQHVGSIRWIN